MAMTVEDFGEDMYIKDDKGNQIFFRKSNAEENPNVIGFVSFDYYPNAYVEKINSTLYYTFDLPGGLLKKKINLSVLTKGL
jgi:hypothetical protein